MSYDFLEEDLDPSSNFPWHGTSCGGIIGSIKNGLICGVGIAYNTNLGGKQSKTRDPHKLSMCDFLQV